MPSAAVRRAMQDKVISILDAAVGLTSNETYKVVTFDSKIGDRPLTDFPLVVVNVRGKEQNGPGEFGTMKELWNWNVEIYYMDIEQDYSTGEEKRDFITDKIENVLETNYRLDFLSVDVNTSGNKESVYDTNFTSVLFDSSGQDGYYTFVSELYLSVDTQRN